MLPSSKQNFPETLTLKSISGYKNPLVKVALGVLDSVLGFKTLNHIYHAEKLYGLSGKTFLDKSLAILDLALTDDQGCANAIKKPGAHLIVCNHPLGGVEGLLMLHLMLAVRDDIKVMANRVLSYVPELKDYFIETNPLKANATGNSYSIKQALGWLQDGHVLLVFPAGRVSYPQQDNIITDHEWNRIVAMLADKSAAPITPCLIEAENRPLFYTMGKIYYRFRMLMLLREMLSATGKKIKLNTGNTIRSLPNGDNQQKTDLAKLLLYSARSEIPTQWQQITSEKSLKAIAQPVAKEKILKDLQGLSATELLAGYKEFRVYAACYEQIPSIVAEIQRQREIEFRRHNEGSGEPVDGDDYDKTYVHLFIFDTETNQIVGAYRMGQTDLLLQSGNPSGNYLLQMFNFGDKFPYQYQPCLEMGRSFIQQNYQKSFAGLMLLFKGIGQYLVRNPQYRMLYGTVSLSTLYKPVSVELIKRFLCEDLYAVKPKIELPELNFVELKQYLDKYQTSFEHLDWLVRHIEDDQKGLPILLKQYHQLGAKFHCVGLDPNFATTPGLLLSVDIAKMPTKYMNKYLGEGSEAYLRYAENGE